MIRPYVVIIFQTLVTLGLGVNGMLSIIMLYVPGGDEIVGELLNTSTPEIHVVVITLICLVATIGFTCANIQSLKWKEGINEKDNPS